MPDLPGVYHLFRDGDVVGGVTFLTEAGWRVDLLVDDVVHGLNHPVPLEQRTVALGVDQLAARRAARAGHPSAS